MITDNQVAFCGARHLAVMLLAMFCSSRRSDRCGALASVLIVDVVDVLLDSSWYTPCFSP